MDLSEFDANYYDQKSDAPCSKCGQLSVRFREIDEIHGDARWKCFACGHSGITEGPDY